MAGITVKDPVILKVLAATSSPDDDYQKHLSNIFDDAVKNAIKKYGQDNLLDHLGEVLKEPQKFLLLGLSYQERSTKLSQKNSLRSS